MKFTFFSGLMARVGRWMQRRQRRYSEVDPPTIGAASGVLRKESAFIRRAVAVHTFRLSPRGKRAVAGAAGGFNAGFSAC
jgi:hypothetical protein